jgi:hypothetical protein
VRREKGEGEGRREKGEGRRRREKGEGEGHRDWAGRSLSSPSPFSLLLSPSTECRAHH